MQTVIGYVTEINGHYVAQAANGEVRELQLNDPIFENDVVTLQAEADELALLGQDKLFISIALNNGEVIELADAAYLLFDESVVGKDVLADAELITNDSELGDTLFDDDEFSFDDLDATAAGAESFGSGSGFRDNRGQLGGGQEFNDTNAEGVEGVQNSDQRSESTPTRPSGDVPDFKNPAISISLGGGDVDSVVSEDIITNDNQPTLDIELTDLESGDLLKILDEDGNVIGEHIVTALDIENGRANVTIDTPLDDGTQKIVITINDEEAGELELAIDTSTQATVELENIGGDNADSTTIKGEIEEGGTLTSIVVGDGEGNEIVVPVADIVIGEDGSFEVDVDLSELEDGDITVTIGSSDEAGNETEATDTANKDTNTDISSIGDSDLASNSVSENINIGDAVNITVKALDVDSEDTVTYSLSDDADGLFSIDSLSGVVSVAGNLDAETSTSHTITATATSSDGSSVSQQFVIGVSDADGSVDGSGDTDNSINDVIDDNSRSNSVSENAAIGDVVHITANAIDLDGDDVRYELSDDANGLFAIDSTTGVVTIAGNLDADSATSHTIEVTAFSTDGSSASEQFDISVTQADNTTPGEGDTDNSLGDVSDSDNLQNSVNENAVIGDVVNITANAIDLDGDSVTYTLLDDANGKFNIDAQSGVVTVAGNLDADTQSSHNIEVQALSSDGSLSTESFTITVSQANGRVAGQGDTDRSIGNVVDVDNDSNSVSADATIGTQVNIVAQASDADNDRVSYELINNANGKFAINANSGVVTVAGELSAGNENITVRATSTDGSTSTKRFSIGVEAVAEPEQPVVPETPVTPPSGGGGGGGGTPPPPPPAGDETANIEINENALVAKTNDTTVNISGTSSDVEAGQSVTVTLSDGANSNTANVNIAADGSWSVSVSTASLSDGNLDISATVSDVAGNVANDNANGLLELDTTTDATITITTSGETNDSTPVISGTSSNVSRSISVTMGGATYEVSPAADGSWSVDTETATPSSGNFNFSSDGDYPISASGNDADGNPTQATASLELDTTTDATISINDMTETNDTTPTISGSSSNVSGSITVTIGGSEYSVTPDQNGDWSVAVNPLGEDGDYTITANGEDADGNPASEATSSLELDTTTDANISINEMTETNDTTPVISGTSSNVSGSITVTVGGATYEITPDQNGDWSLDTETATPSSGSFLLATDGNYDITANGEDSDGNPAGEANENFTLDTTSVTPTIDLAASSDTGSSDSDDFTADYNPLFEGTAEALSTVTVYEDSVAVGTTQTDDNGNWSFNYEENTLSLLDRQVTSKAEVDSDAHSSQADAMVFNRSEFGSLSKNFSGDDSDADGDGYELAQNVESATALSARFVGTINNQSDKDFVKVELKAGEKLILDIDYGYENRGEASDIDTEINVYDASGNILLTQDDDHSPLDGGEGSQAYDGGGTPRTLDSFAEFTVPSDGEYYISVSAFENGYEDAGSYQLWMSIENPQFDFTASAVDGAGNSSESSNTLTVTLDSEGITDISANNAPTPTDDSYGDVVIPDSGVFVINSDDLLANDSDDDGDTITLTSVQDAVNGEVSINDDGNIVFTPTANFEGDVSFTYTITDSLGESSSATVSATVSLPAIENEIPEADDITIAVSGSEASFSLTEVVSDTEDDSDVNDDKVTQIEITSNVNHGTLYNAEGNEVEVGDRYDDISTLRYVSDETHTDSLLMGSKTDSGNQNDWGNESNGTYVYTADNLETVTITGTRDGIDSDVVYDWDNLGNHEGVGIGVKGGDDAQIEKSEALTYTFSSVVSSATISLAGVGGNYVEGNDNQPDARAHYEAYLDGQLVDSGEMRQDGENVDGDNNLNTINFDIDVAFDSLVFTTVANQESNYTVKYIEAEYQTNKDSFEYKALDSDGSYSNETAKVTLEVTPDVVDNEIPDEPTVDGASLTMQISDATEVTSGGDKEVELENGENIFAYSNRENIFTNALHSTINLETLQNNNAEVSGNSGNGYGVASSGESNNQGAKVMDFDGFHHEALVVQLGGSSDNAVLSFKHAQHDSIHLEAYDANGNMVDINPLIGFGDDYIYHWDDAEFEYTINAQNGANFEYVVISTNALSVSDHNGGKYGFNFLGTSVNEGPEVTSYTYEIELEAGKNDESETLGDIHLYNLPEGSTLVDSEGNSVDPSNIDVSDDEKVTLTLSVSEELSEDEIASIGSFVGTSESNNETMLVLSDDDGIDFDTIEANQLSRTDTIDLRENGEHRLENIEIRDVIDMSDGNNEITIYGSSDDTVTLKNGDTEETTWQQVDNVVEGGNTFEVYQNTDQDVTIKIDIDIDPNVI